MDLSLLAGFAAVSITLAMTPGADWAYSISAGLRGNRIAPAVAGLSVGYLFHTALIVAGLAALIAATPQLLVGITLLGAAYLLWLGISTMRTWRSAGFTADTTTAAPAAAAAVPGTTAAGGRAVTAAGLGAGPGTAGSIAVAAPAPAHPAARTDFLKGLGTSATNPKALLLYLALIPQFVDAGSVLAVPLQSLILGLSHFAVSVVIYTCVALAARRLLRSRPAGARAVTLASGIIMVCLSLVLLAEQGAALFG
ncbi:LysE family translocator [Arthrobacter sp. Sa2CUA1]|uniref:LysE family translocator n=1 Tax=Arthrobacter gallicola TaxID=2762225 RepID=A0ABR8UQR0_9MICC|nr:LysE family translocator [Arthrobacter gallicola]MBD7994566.1 LysE family translocator [Arthrobacter gallicola]